MRDKILEIALVSILTVFGVLISLIYGRIGFMPMDQSIVFDGGWRILSGQIPFKDFITPNGFIPMLIQAGFFKVLGTTWFAYCLHAAVFNGLFSVLAFCLLRLLGSPRWMAFGYALLSSVVFYPPFGVPFLEQHAFFFILLALVLAMVATHTSHSVARAAAWMSVPGVLLLAYLSKQIPAVFGLPLMLAVAVTMAQPRVKSVLGWLLAGTLVACASLLLIINAFQMDVSTIRYYIVDLPAGVGKMRYILAPFHAAMLRWSLASVHLVQFFFLGALCLLLGMLRPKWQPVASAVIGIILKVTPLLVIVFAIYLINPGLFLPDAEERVLQMVTDILTSLLLGLLVFNFLMIWLMNRPGQSEAGNHQAPYTTGISRLMLAEALILICFFFSSLTYNNPANGIPYVFISLGLVNLYLYPLFSDLVFPKLSLANKPLQITVVVGIVLLSTGAWDAYNFNHRINAVRTIHDIHYQGGAKGESPDLPPAMDFLVWETPPALPAMICDHPDECAYLPEDLTQLVAFLEAQPENFFLMGDTAALYGIAGRPSINPSLWFHYGLTMPWPRSAEFAAFEARLMDNLMRNQVRFIVVEGEHTWGKARLQDFTQLHRLVQEKTCKTQRFGVFQVMELCPNAYSGHRQEMDLPGAS